MGTSRGLRGSSWIEQFGLRLRSMVAERAHQLLDRNHTSGVGRCPCSAGRRSLVAQTTRTACPQGRPNGRADACRPDCPTGRPPRCHRGKLRVLGTSEVAHSWSPPLRIGVKRVFQARPHCVCNAHFIGRCASDGISMIALILMCVTRAADWLALRFCRLLTGARRVGTRLHAVDRRA